jgi:hypothetical protein
MSTKIVLKGLFILLITQSLFAKESPQNPSDLTLEALSQREVKINWRDNSSDETGFKIYRDDVLISITVPNSTSYIDRELIADTAYKYTVKATNDEINTFADIKNLIQNSKDGLIDATYILVSDDTRSGDLSPFDDPTSPYSGGYLFDLLLDTLSDYGVDANLYARDKHTISEFKDENSSSPTWEDVVNIIPDDGNTTIVDISLGINDLNSDDANIDTIKTNLQNAIENIKDHKPNTHFILTMPVRKYSPSNIQKSYQEAAILSSVYKQVSSQMNIPLIDTMDELIPNYSQLNSDWYLKDSSGYHLNKEGQQILSDYILEKIMPKLD